MTNGGITMVETFMAIIILFGIWVMLEDMWARQQ